MDLFIPKEYGDTSMDLVSQVSTSLCSTKTSTSTNSLPYSLLESLYLKEIFGENESYLLDKQHSVDTMLSMFGKEQRRFNRFQNGRSSTKSDRYLDKNSLKFGSGCGNFEDDGPDGCIERSSGTSSLKFRRKNSFIRRYRSASPSFINTATSNNIGLAKNLANNQHWETRDKFFQIQCFYSAVQSYSVVNYLPNYIQKLRQNINTSETLSSHLNTNNPLLSNSSTLDDIQDKALSIDEESVNDKKDTTIEVLLKDFMDNINSKDSSPIESKKMDQTEEKQNISTIKPSLTLNNWETLETPCITSQREPRKRFCSLITDVDVNQYNNSNNHRHNHHSPEDMNLSMQRLSTSSLALHRRSLSPLTLSLIANFGADPNLVGSGFAGATTSANETTTGGLLGLDSFGFSRRANLVNRRRFHSVPRRRTLCTGMPGTSFQNNEELKRRCEQTLKENNENVEEDSEEKTPNPIEDEKPRKKPAAILVYAGDDFELFNRISTSLKNILIPHTYTVRDLSTSALISHPWIDENCACLLLANTKSLNDQAWTRLQTYFSGKILFLCQNSLLANLTNCNSLKKQTNILKSAFDKKGTVLGKDFEQFLKKSVKILDQPLLLYMQNSELHASALFSDATTDELLQSSGGSLISDAMSRLGIQVKEKTQSNSIAPKLTPGFMVAQKDRIIRDIQGLCYSIALGADPKLTFNPNRILRDIDADENNSEFLADSRGDQICNKKEVVDKTNLPIKICRRKEFVCNEDFDLENYYSVLKTKSLAQVLIYVPVCESTMNISKSLLSAFPTFDGILVVAGCQLNGRGRSGNDWISPKGCAMITFNFNIPLNSTLGQALGFVQHIMAVAIVDAIVTLIKIEDFPIQIKWPNDIYYGRLYKIGGILVNALMKSNQYECVIGAGINVANSKPTVCINDFLPADSEKQLTMEEVIAETMNKFELYVNMFVNQGKSAFLKQYYNHWIHTREEVSILHKESNAKEKVIIRGLDEYGYLEVRSKQTGQIFSVHDDGNTFDMLKGLIHSKN